MKEHEFMTRAFIFAFATLLAACSEPAPEPVRTPERDRDFHVTTMASTIDRRFLVEFRSLTSRPICISADEWPTADGVLGANRPDDASDEPQRVGARDTLTAFVRFDQLPPASLEGDALRQVDIVPVTYFCAAPQ